MKLVMLCKDDKASGKDTGCPSVYLGESGELVIQGWQVDADTFAQLQNVLPGEVAVRIRTEVVRRALALHPGG